MKTVLITGIGGPTPRSIAKAIREKNKQIRIIGVDSSYKAIGFFMVGLVDEFFVIPRATNPEYWITILKIIKDHNVEFAFVQPELEVIEWGKYFLEQGEFPCKVLIPPLKLSECLVDKSKMANILEGTSYIPKTINITQDNPKFDEIVSNFSFPCWTRAIQGSGGLASLKVNDIGSLKSWLLINSDIQDFAVSEYLPGRHLANQMLYYQGEYIKGASLECVEYVMADLAPSKVTGNTSYGRFINEDRILEFCNSCIELVSKKLNISAHGVLSFDLKEDLEGNLKVTEVNIRHMAYTGVMAKVGFDLVNDTINILEFGTEAVNKSPFFHYDKPYSFLRDVDIEPIIIDDRILKSNLFLKNKL